RELVQDRAAALGAREPREGARGVAADEAEDDPRLPARRRVVHGEPDRALEVDHAPREAVVAPERPVVDGRHLGQRGLGRRLGWLAALVGELGRVDDPPRERRRDGYDVSLSAPATT